MKKLLFTIIFVFCLLCFPKTIVFAHYDRAYWHEETATTQFTEQYRDWMISLPDDKRLAELSIPGTHDSMAFSSTLPFINFSRTQTMTLEQQLQSGIRYLDIRLAYRQNYFQLYHGIIDLNYQLNDVLNTVTTFLSSHPTETILIRIKQEYTKIDDQSMLSLFNKYYSQYEQYFWNKTTSENPNNPKLSELRGKICILSDVSSIQQGISYSTLNTQDNYSLAGNGELYSKWLAIKRHINNTNSDFYKNTISINHLSASGGVYPYFVASGHITDSTYAHRLSTGLTEPAFRGEYPDFPRTARFGIFATISYEGTNTLTADYLYNNQISRAGIIVSDFPGERLINEVIQCNYR